MILFCIENETLFIEIYNMIMEEKKCAWCKKPLKNETPETHYCLVKRRVDEWEAKKKAQGEVKRVK